jgi:hypothetical protein
MLSATSAIIAKDVKEHCLILIFLLMGGQFIALIIGASVNWQDSPFLFCASMLNVSLPVALALPIYLVIKEKNKGTWIWLRTLTGNRAKVVVTKFALFVTAYLIVTLGQWPAWKIADLPWHEETKMRLWRYGFEVAWVAGCSTFAAACYVRRSFKPLLLVFISFYQVLGGLSVLLITSQEISNAALMVVDRYKHASLLMECSIILSSAFAALLISICVERDTD